MTIESSLHARGTRELIRRLQESLALSSHYMDEGALNTLQSQVRKKIEVLQEALCSYEEKRKIEVATDEWMVISLPPDASFGRSLFSQFEFETSTIRVPLRKSARGAGRKPANRLASAFKGMFFVDAADSIGANAAFPAS